MAAQAVGVERQRSARAPAGRLQIDRLAADHARRPGRFGDHDRSAVSVQAGLRPGRIRPVRAVVTRLAARAARTPRPAARRRRAPRCRRRRRRAASGGRAAACRCPSPAGRRGSASRCESSRWRTRPAARARSPIQRPGPHLGGTMPFDGVGGGERQRRAQPLAAGEDAVAHRLADDRRARGRRREIALERLVDPDARVCSRNAASESEARRSRLSRVRRSVGSNEDAGAGFSSPRSLRISMRRSASSSRAWQKRDSCTPRSYKAERLFERRSPPRVS